MDRENARNFIAFICNARTSKLSDDFFENNKFYHLLVGDLADNPMLEYNVKSEFLGYALTQIDKYIQKSGSAASETRDNLVEFFSEKYVGEIQGLATSPIEETVSWGLGVIWEYGSEVADSLSTLVSFAQDPDKFTDDLKMIMNGITYLYASEVNKVYTYFDVALDFADYDDDYDSIMSMQKDLILLSGDYDGSNLALLIPGMDSWIDWVEPIKYWAKYVYNMSLDVMYNPPFYTITYIMNSPTDSNYSVTYETNQSPDYPHLYRENHIFDGWYTDSSCTQPASQSTRSNQTWYAKWIPQYKIVFNSNCNSVDSVSYIYTSKKDWYIPEMERPGFSFQGWYWDPECTSKFTETTVNRDLTFYAKWTPLYDFTVSNNEVTITDLIYYRVINGVAITDIVLPDYIDGYPVTKIGDNAFENCENLTGITLGQNVVSVGNSAFRNCKSLEKIKFNENLISIGEYSFYSCKNLKSAPLPNSLCALGKYAFAYCTSIKATPTYTLKDTQLTSIDDFTFYGCSNISQVRLPDSLLSIGNSSFAECTSLSTSINFPDSLTKIGEYAFSNSPIKGTLYLTQKITHIGDYAFLNCQLSTIYIRSENLNYIGKNAFECSTLKSITGNTDNYSTSDGVLFNKDKSVLLKYPSGKTNYFYAIPDSVKTISDSAFKNCPNLKTLKIPDNIEKIDNGNITDCTNIEKILYSNSKEQWNSKFLPKFSQMIYNCCYCKESTNNTLIIVTNDEKTTSIYINPTEDLSNNTVILGTYDLIKKKLTFSDSAVLNNNEIHFNTNSNYHRIKIFIWDNLEGLTPLCKPIIINRTW